MHGILEVRTYLETSECDVLGTILRSKSLKISSMLVKEDFSASSKIPRCPSKQARNGISPSKHQSHDSHMSHLYLVLQRL